MKFKIIKDFAQIDSKYQDKTKSETEVWQYVDVDDSVKDVEANTCYFVKLFDEIGKFNVAISDENKEVKFLFHNIDIDLWGDASPTTTPTVPEKDVDLDYNLIFKIRIENWNEAFVAQSEINNFRWQLNKIGTVERIDFGNGTVKDASELATLDKNHWYTETYTPGEYVVKFKVTSLANTVDFSFNNICEIIQFPVEMLFEGDVVRNLHLNNNKVPENGFIEMLSGYLTGLTTRNITLTPKSNEYNVIDISSQLGHFHRKSGANAPTYKQFSNGNVDLRQDVYLNPYLYPDTVINNDSTNKTNLGTSPEKRVRSQAELDLCSDIFDKGIIVRNAFTDKTVTSPKYTKDILGATEEGSLNVGVEYFRVVPCIENKEDSWINTENIFFVVGVNEANGSWSRRFYNQNTLRHVYRQNIKFVLQVEVDGVWKEVATYGLRNANTTTVDVNAPMSANVVEYLDVNLNQLKSDLSKAGIKYSGRLPKNPDVNQGRLNMRFNFIGFNGYKDLYTGVGASKHQIFSNPRLTNSAMLQSYKNKNIIAEDGNAYYTRKQAIAYQSMPD